MADGENTQFFLGALRGGLDSALDYGESNKTAADANQQFSERQPPTNTTGATNQTLPSTIPTYVYLGAAVVGLVVLLAVVKR